MNAQLNFDNFFTQNYIIEEVEGLYSQVLPYHNFLHVLTTVNQGIEITKLFRRQGLKVDLDTVYLALLFHDAGYHEDHIQKGFCSKETYSAHLAEITLDSYNLSPTLIRNVMSAICATASDAEVKSLEQQIVRVADLYGLAAEYPVFRNNTQLLKDEHELLSGFTLSWADWIDKATVTIGQYLAGENLYFPAAFHRGFINAAQQNLNRLIAEKPSLNNEY